MFKVYKQTLGSGDYLLYLVGEGGHCIANDHPTFKAFMEKILQYIREGKIEEAKWLATSLTYSRWNDGQKVEDMHTFNTRLYCKF